MWFTTRQDGLDDNCHTNRGPCFQISGFFGTTLRIGFFLEFIALTFLFMAYWSSGGKGLFSYDLKNMKDEYRLDQTFRNSITLWSGVYLIGAIFIMSFQVLLADDTCWARGYRAGSKILRLASFLDTISATLQFIFYLYISKFYTRKWYVHFNEGGSEWVFFIFVRLVHAFSCLLYGLAAYLLEVYHDEGAGDLHAYINGVMFAFAGLTEIFVIFCNSGCYSNFLLWLALGAVSLWSYYFEPEVNHVSPALHETELTNDVEQQVEKFSRYTPYPQEQNQNAYYPA
ncbi:glideosome associated protein with multiple membrane spans 3, putative [Plasmodium vivax]|uniref:Glideosome associated protein with multiple membrane spans 3 n=6 Tax=Plasmodium vivax TaxID=5855 RepID=A5K1F7_PLAVS|nr:hypothetical protein, conserved [Plasmodium vivax]KMZ78347.1 hypothetical protein PVIIG_02345 [Plasmodium vivax India VII]KMZ83951.1 hypothetical protein PVBG_01030 [Plasmodium vivax Brazil I]KMZ90787.1 hypothetical protein PVMG_02955 [Plasmodium vivax Mauritania I]KMZ97309.1 hypothetical protein PVNG_06093 [Plasmodium vivax North Korean]EDL47154.1 hypothetical protein, conserved [Plasmodium vivax]|eukprot:XP_001616881.1 hypothetical protein [Plasmodium vivax Sal-1]